MLETPCKSITIFITITPWLIPGTQREGSLHMDAGLILRVSALHRANNIIIQQTAHRLYSSSLDKADVQNKAQFTLMQLAGGCKISKDAILKIVLWVERQCQLTEAAVEYQGEFHKIAQEGSYQPEQIISCNETTLYWKNRQTWLKSKIVCLGLSWLRTRCHYLFLHQCHWRHEAKACSRLPFRCGLQH